MSWIHALTPRRLKVAMIGLPVALSCAYYLLFAADRFVSESIVTVRQANHEAGNMPGMAMLLAGANPPSREDALYLRQYVHSLELLQRLEARLHLREHYEAQGRDLLFRLYGRTSQEWFHEYYRSRVEVRFDDSASLLTVRVEAFAPDFAQRVNQTILQESERFVNTLSQRMSAEQLRFAESELQRAAGRLQAAKAQVLAFQTTHKVLDPMVQAQAAGTLSAELQASLSKQEAELKNALSYLNEDSYQVKALRSQVGALRSQLGTEHLRATAGQGGERLNALAAEFQDLKLQAGFAEDAYKLALTAVESARIEATRKVKSVVVIEPSSKPESAAYPRRLYNLVTLLIVCTLLYAVASLVVATIREHQD
jgi:capsular polysaccharide transport system permease protein